MSETVQRHQRDVLPEEHLLAMAAVVTVLNFALISLLQTSPPSENLGLLAPTTLRHFQPISSPNRSLRGRLMAPADQRHSLPLVVFLHGAGRRGEDNVQQLKGFPEQMASVRWRHRFSCLILAPQCPADAHWSDCMVELEELIDHVLGEYNVDRSRVYLTGLSMGGFGSWELAARRPEVFAAFVPICGGGNPRWASGIAEIPVWAIHGDVDDVVPVERSREMVEAVLQCGGTVKYSELSGVGHDSWTATYADPDGVISWMFEQSK